MKGCIPEATLREFNPRIEAQVQELAAVAGDPAQLKQHYVERKDRQQERPQAADDLGEDAPKAKSEWLYESLKTDKYGQLTGFSKVNKGLERDIKGEWQESAVRGISVPSAMAQHHSKFKPWECCNKDLPHGAIVAYYRSPFPNVGAAAIAINNTEDLKEQDREAFSKTGVAYLNPWTAKHIAITDFDRDANGYFVGYEATVPDLPQQLRQQLADTENLSPAEQYEVGRAAIGQLIEQADRGQDNRIAQAEYLLAVKEFVERTAPDKKPPEIEKQKKVKHPWYEGESHSTATWRAWGITADNPTGKVANAGMTLQSFALEMRYAPQEQQEGLLRQIATSFSKQLRQANAGKLSIPSDDELQSQGFPAYHFRERMEEIASAPKELSALPSSQKQQFVQQKLLSASKLLSDAVDGPNAVNLQTAVDTAKSSRGIDDSHHAFIRGLAYKDHELRQHQKDPNNYTNGRLMPTNTQEPIGWNVEAVNAVYKDVHLPELRNEAFRDLFPKTATPQQEEKALSIARTYNDLIANYQTAKDRLREKRPEDEQPTLQVTSSSGRSLTLQNIKDKDGELPIWRANGPQPDWEIAIRQNHQSKSEQFVASLTYTAAGGDRVTAPLGTVAPESVSEHHLAERLQKLPNHTLTIPHPIAQIQAPYAQQNDADEMLERATQYVDTAIAEIPKEERQDYLSALWRYSDGMKTALKHFTPEIVERLESVPEITLTGLQHTSNEAGQIPPGEYTARFSEFSYEKNGETRTASSVTIITDEGEEKQLGAISARSMHLPIGTTVQAHIQIEPSGKIAKMQVLDLAPEPEPQAVEAQAQTTSCILATDANHCLYRFVNNDDVDNHQTDAPEVLAILQAAEDRGLPHRTEFLAQANVVQAIATIDFPNQSVLEQFEQDVTPLPIQFKYEGELTGDFQFVDQQMQDMLDERPDLVSVPDAATLATFEPDGSFMASSRGASQFAVSSTQFTNQDRSNEAMPMAAEPQGDYQIKDASSLTIATDAAAAGTNVEFEWVRGHQEHPLNERADAIATSFAQGRPTELKQADLTQPSAADESITPTGKPVKMAFPLMLHGEKNPLPVDTCLEAMRGYGRTHTTRSYEPYKAYGFKEGDIAIAHSGNKQVAFQVGEQYRITPAMMDDPNYQQQWAAQEKHSPRVLQSFQGKNARGLKMEPLGDYQDGKITPFPDRSGEIYSPSREELRQWCAVAIASSDEPLTAEVIGKGKQLNALYTQETGSREKPPMDYRHPSLVISQGDRQQMQQAIAEGKQTLAAMAQSQQSQRHKASAELAQ